MAASKNQPVLRFRSGFAGELGSMLHKAALEGEGTDVEIRIGETSIKTVHAHSCVLQTGSEVFKVMLGERWKQEKKPEDGKTVIDLPEDKYLDFVLFLQLLYGFQDLTLSNFNEVLPAYKLVDKYAAPSALRLCDEYFQFLIDNMEKLDAARLLWMAKDHHVEILYKAAMEHVKTNFASTWLRIQKVQQIRIAWRYQSWMDWDEETLIEIISTDGLKVMSNQQEGNFNWSHNEYNIAVFTQLWLLFRRSTDNEEDHTADEPPTQRELHAVDFESSSRVFSKIRVLQMTNDDFQNYVYLLAGLLPKAHIADISVAFCEKGKAKRLYVGESDFAVDRSLRKI